MHRLVTLALLLGLGACAAPAPAEGIDSDGGAPEIRLLYPDYDEDLSFMLNADGTFDLFVVVDILNYEYLPPEGNQNPVHVDGQGHYHVLANGSEYLSAPDNLYYEVVTDAFSVGSSSITVDLRTNDHIELDLEGCTCSVTFEFEMLAYDGG